MGGTRNRCLTVEAGRPNSHENKGWEQITDAAIRALNERKDAQGRVDLGLDAC